MIRKNLAVFLLITGCALNQATQASIIDFDVDADAAIRSGVFANDNLGNTPFLNTKASGAASNFTYKSYFRFDISSITNTIMDAELTLQINSISTAGFTLDIPHPSGH